MKDGFVKVAAAAPPIIVADCDYNATKIIEDIIEADRQGIKLLAFPELAVTGYTVGDLIFQDSLYESSLKALERIKKATEAVDMLVLVGMALREGGKTYNCGAVFFKGRTLGIVPKVNLPTYAEFYELRTFENAPEQNRIVTFLGEPCVFGTKILFCCERLKEFIVACEICEDIWVANSPSLAHTAAGATIAVNLSASNDFVCKAEFRRDMVSMQSAKETGVYLYTSSGETESTADVVFSSHRIIAELGVVLGECEPFEQTRFAVCDVDLKKVVEARFRGVSVSSTDDRGYTKIPFDCEVTETKLTTPAPPLVFVPSDKEQLLRRCRDILNIQYHGLKKRMTHIGAKKLLLGVSGGLDSTLALIVSCMALDSLSMPRSDLIAVTMPCFGTTERTRKNAELLSRAVGADFREIDISKTVESHLADIGIEKGDRSVAVENAQARERTQVLFDLSNVTGGLVVGTGDLSESALGFATYNGDHISSYGVNCSVPKTIIPHLLAYAAQLPAFSGIGEIVKDIVATPISPELLPTQDGVQTQLTQNTTGPYELVDFFLYYFVRWGFSASKTLRVAKHAFGDKYTTDEIKKWLIVFYRRFFANQFKRSCLPDGPKVGSVSLSPRGDFRMPSDVSASIWIKELSE